MRCPSIASSDSLVMSFRVPLSSTRATHVHVSPHRVSLQVVFSSEPRCFLSTEVPWLMIHTEPTAAIPWYGMRGREVYKASGFQLGYGCHGTSFRQPLVE